MQGFGDPLSDDFHPERKDGEPGDGTDESGEEITEDHDDDGIFEDGSEDEDSEEEEEEEADESEDDYSELSKAELVALIEQRNRDRSDDDQLPTSGNKAKLSSTLREDDES